MKQIFEDIDALITSGEVDHAVSHLIDIADKNRINSNELKSLKSQYSLVEKKISLGLTENDLTTSLNRIILGIIKAKDDLLEQLQKNNFWTDKEIECINNHLFSTCVDCLIDEFGKSKYNWYINESLCISDIEYQIDDKYWYIINWKVAISNKSIHTFTIAPNNMFCDFKDGNTAEVSSKDLSFLRETIKQELLKTIDFYGLPYFNMRVSDFYPSTYGEIMSQYIIFSSAMFPNNQDREKYLWQDIE